MYGERRQWSFTVFKWVRKVSMKKYRSPKDKFKIAITIIVAILIIGIVTQSLVDFVDGERLKRE